MIVAFEGMAGSGKSTLVQAVALLCKQSSRPCCVVEEFPAAFLRDAIKRQIEIDPYLSLIGADDGGLAQTLLLLSVHAFKWEALIRPAIRRGELVLVDRYVDSVRAFQTNLLAKSGVMDRLQAATWINACAQHLHPADLVVHVDVPIEVGTLRRLARGEKVTAEDARFAEEVRAETAKALSARDPRKTLSVINVGKVEPTATSCLDWIVSHGPIGRVL